VVHCDLDVGSINYAYELSRRDNLERILFVRCDYLQLPFASNIFDRIICMDTLERGLSHEIRLLTEILRCLKPGGKVAIDFHNKFRSLFSASKINSEVVGYDQMISSEVNLKRYEIKPIGYVPNIVPFEKGYKFLDKVL